MEGMNLRSIICGCTIIFLLGCQSRQGAGGRASNDLAITKASKITFDENGALVIDGNKVFPITLTVIPGPDAKAPSGKPAYREFREAGCLFMRSGSAEFGTGKSLADEKRMQQAAAANGMRCSPWIGWSLGAITPGDTKNEELLRNAVNTLKNSPGMGMWKGADEPEWGNESDPKKHTPEQVINAGRIMHENDPNHPIWLVQAPRGTVASLKRYDAGWDVGGIDIYPISYPPGIHSELPNKELSMVGDWTRFMKEVAGKKPFWMTLQIAFSGVVKPGKTLRFPTFAEQRFMAYQAIINGSRGLTYFGGALPQTFNERDKQYGYNWTYFDKVMKPLFEEIGLNSPIEAALIAPDSKLQLKVTGVQGPKKGDPVDAKPIEFLVRDTGNELYVFACMNNGPTIEVKFDGLPAEYKAGEVVFEEPRGVKVDGGAFTDWFGPWEVHVYRFRKG
jgi:hypothetical protein